MQTRPLSVTFVGWILMILGTLELWQTFSLLLAILNGGPDVKIIFSYSTLPIPVQWAFIAAGAVIALLCGLYILKGSNWARILYPSWVAFCYILEILIEPGKDISLSDFIFLFLICLILFLPGANKYFASRDK
jgi:hypothetical protein